MGFILSRPNKKPKAAEADVDQAEQSTQVDVASDVRQDFAPPEVDYDSAIHTLTTSPVPIS